MKEGGEVEGEGDGAHQGDTLCEEEGCWEVTTREKSAKEALYCLLSDEEALTIELGVYKEDSEKENWDVGEGSSHGVLCPIYYAPSPEHIPIPPPKKKPSLEKATEDLCQQFEEGRQKFLSGDRVPWLEHQLEMYSLEQHVERSGIGYVSVSDVDEFLDHVVGHL